MNDKTCINDKLLNMTVDAFASISGFKLEDFKEHQFLDRSEVMSLLKCSATTLQNYRDQNKFEFYQISSKHILYHRGSVEEFIKSKSVTKWK